MSTLYPISNPNVDTESSPALVIHHSLSHMDLVPLQTALTVSTKGKGNPSERGFDNLLYTPLSCKSQVAQSVVWSWPSSHQRPRVDGVHLENNVPCNQAVFLHRVHLSSTWNYNKLILHQHVAVMTTAEPSLSAAMKFRNAEFAITTYLEIVYKYTLAL